MPGSSREAAYFIMQILLGYNLEVAEDLVRSHGIYEYMLPHLDIDRRSDIKVILVILKSLTGLFSKERIMGSNNFYLMFESSGGVDLVEGLQNHPH